jgi:hypothetical protein
LKVEYTIAANKLVSHSPAIWAEFAVLSAILLASILIPPYLANNLLPCPIKSVTGIPCPGCGMTRAFLNIGHGHISTALRFNPNSLLAFLIILSLWINRTIYFIAGKEVLIRLARREKIWLYTLLGLDVLAVWIYNLFLNNWA